MNVFVFRPSNEFFGKFPVESSQDIRRALEEFLKSQAFLPEYSYVEVDGKTWTIINRDPLTLEPGRLVANSPTMKKRAEEAEMQRRTQVERVTSQLKNPLGVLLAQHIGKVVYLNYNGPDSVDAAYLAEVTDAHFSVQVEQQLRIHVPLSQVLQIAEPLGAPASIRIMQLVVYKGAVGVSVPMSLG